MDGVIVSIRVLPKVICLVSEKKNLNLAFAWDLISIKS